MTEADLYSVLNIPRTADAREIKKAYFDLAREQHPDKGGNEEKFKEIQRAYSILSDPQKKDFYDQTGQVLGESGNPEGGGPFGGGGVPFDLSQLFGGLFGGGMPFGFGSGGGGRQPGGPPSSMRQPVKAPPKIQNINLTLSDLYHGRSLKINFERQRFCQGCNGNGYMNFLSCTGCNGRGRVGIQQMIGPGMIVMNEVPCSQCQGTGSKRDQECGRCHGKCFINEQKALEVTIERGMRAGERLVFSGECSDTQEFAQAGDVIIVLEQADEPIPWRREGDILRATLEVSFTEALCGCKKVLPGHPGFPTGCDVDIRPGHQHLDTLVIKEAGMPKRDGIGKGDALITLHVIFGAKEREVCEKHTELLRSILATNMSEKT